jgi:MoaA/NifB/PqqE/SkfB family radical SAM enzyme
LIDYIKENYPTIKIKINTMVGKPNINDVINIGKLIENKVYSWKLSKFLSSGYGRNHADEFEISDLAFAKVANECQKFYKVCNAVEDFKVNENEIFDVFIDGLGHVNIHKEGEIENIGDIDNLDNYDLNKSDMNKDYLNLVYKHKEVK